MNSNIEYLGMGVGMQRNSGDGWSAKEELEVSNRR